MFFVIRKEWLQPKKEYIEAKLTLSHSYKYQMIKKVYIILMALIIICGSLFVLYNPDRMRIAEITIPVVLLMLAYWYISMLKRFPKGEIVGNALKQQIADSLKRGIIAGIVLSIAIIIFLILYFIYLLRTE